MKLRVGLDVDGVIFDFVSAFREEASELFDRKFPRFSSDWEFSNWGLSPEEYGKLWNKIAGSRNWFDGEKPINKKTVQYLRQLQDISELYFITNRMPTKGESALFQTQSQLDFIGVVYPTVLVRKDKGPVVAGLELNVFVDDYVENLYRVEQCSPGTELFLINQTYNKNLKVPKNWNRVDSLKEVVKYVKEQNAAFAN